MSAGRDRGGRPSRRQPLPLPCADAAVHRRGPRRGHRPTRAWRSGPTTGADPRPWFRCPFGAGAERPARPGARSRASGYRHVGLARRRRGLGAGRGRPRTIEADVVDAARSPTATARSCCSTPGRAATRGALPGPSPAGCARPVRAFVRIDAPRRGPGRTELSVSRARPPDGAVLAVDGGNSKTDVALSSARTAGCWRPCAARRSRTSRSGLPPGWTGSSGSSDAACRGRGLGWPAAAAGRGRGRTRLAGADTPADVRRLTAAFEARRAGRDTLDRQRRVRPDPGRLRSRLGGRRHLRRGRQCGGDRARTDGRARLAALGDISGDWGGGGDLGTAALGPRSAPATAAVRGRLLEALVPGALRAAAVRST